MIRFDASRSLWILETASAAFVFGLARRGSSVDGFPQSRLSGEGLLLQTWYGPRLSDPSEYPEAVPEPGWASFSTPASLSPEIFPAAGGPRYGEPSLACVFPDGVRDSALRYRDYSIDGEKLSVFLDDSAYGLEVELEFIAHPAWDLFSRRAIVRNRAGGSAASSSGGSVLIESLLSGAVYLNRGGEYRLTHLVGRWAGETRIERGALGEGRFTIESSRGFTSHHANPFFALDADARADEDSGDVRFGCLAWSGNWKISFERDNFGLTKVSAGYQDRDFSIPLSSAQEVASPSFMFGFTRGGFGAMSRALHGWQRSALSPSGSELRRVLYNSWEATAFSVDEAGQTALAEKAASLGVELFVMDDGWFGERANDRAGLGDWTVNREKFPRGLGPLIARVKELGMEFGLWVEPEMVNPDSDLYRAHPDWIYHYPGRTRTEMRNQFVLNLSIPAVEAFVFEAMHRLLSENDIRFVKWDLNRSISEPGSHAHGHPRDANIRHIEALYRIMSHLRGAHPDVRFQTCSGGGGRIDPGILAYFDQCWPSDNTDASDRLVIQEGFSLIYGAHLMESWVTARKNWLHGRELSLEYRFHAAMAGVLGIGENLAHWNEEEAATARGLIALYKDIRPLVQNGNLYRLESAASSAEAGACSASVSGIPSGRHPERTSFMYTADDASRAVLFVFLERNRFGGRMPPVYPRGLDPEARYVLVQRSPESPLFPLPSAEIAGSAGMTLSGAAWTERGVSVPLREDHTSAIFEFKRSPLN